MAMVRRFYVFGSSPRTWGKLVDFDFYEKTGSVHPHARGANNLERFISACGFGSSPRTWGKLSVPVSGEGVFAVHPHARGANQYQEKEKDQPNRFIPTHVGQMSTYCLEYSFGFGSSPRTWGKLLPFRQLSHLLPVHPHARGANGFKQLESDFYKRFIPTHVGQMF